MLGPCAANKNDSAYMKIIISDSDSRNKPSAKDVADFRDAVEYLAKQNLKY